ncbi:hypothetical protein BJ085DRAFT_31723 [Dimargaris cristalligena]|uniref:Uncharacterized protein n=1 Tax=Dimargaris cristalligena TaxID=215637 RepID=A0A4P9ZUS2_9FUNG|nr:hypothetical protein BJ085DRAFT_31723 [Dimargaris cristalligena]|eukprot:RKP36350.1 hypothetical protein BJ085DRAFT_31723 [Dimargaris cristalligena]
MRALGTPSPVPSLGSVVPKPQDIVLPPFLHCWVDMGHSLVYTGRELSRIVHQTFAHVGPPLTNNKLPDKFLTTLEAALGRLDPLLVHFNKKCRLALVFDPLTLHSVRQWILILAQKARGDGPGLSVAPFAPSNVSLTAVAFANSTSALSGRALPPLLRPSHRPTVSATSRITASRDESVRTEPSLARALSVSSASTSAAMASDNTDLPLLFGQLVKECRTVLGLAKSLISLIYLEYDNFWVQLEPRILRSVLAVFQLASVELRFVWEKLSTMIRELDLPEDLLNTNLPSPFTRALNSTEPRPVLNHRLENTNKPTHYPVGPTNSSTTTSSSSSSSSPFSSPTIPQGPSHPSDKYQVHQLPQSLQYTFGSSKPTFDSRYQITLKSNSSFTAPRRPTTELGSRPNSTPQPADESSSVINRAASPSLSPSTTAQAAERRRLLTYNIASELPPDQSSTANITSTSNIHPPPNPTNPAPAPGSAVSSTARPPGARANASGESLSIYEKFTRGYNDSTPVVTHSTPKLAPAASPTAREGSSRIFCLKCDFMHSTFSFDQKQLITRCDDLSRIASRTITELRDRIQFLLAHAPNQSSRATSPTPAGSIGNKTVIAIPSPTRSIAAPQPSPDMISHFRRFSQQHPLGSLSAHPASKRIFHSKNNSDGSFYHPVSPTAASSPLSMTLSTPSPATSNPGPRYPSGMGHVRSQSHSSHLQRPKPFLTTPIPSSSLSGSTSHRRLSLGGGSFSSNEQPLHSPTTPPPLASPTSSSSSPALSPPRLTPSHLGASNFDGPPSSPDWHTNTLGTPSGRTISLPTQPEANSYSPPSGSTLTSTPVNGHCAPSPPTTLGVWDVMALTEILAPIRRRLDTLANISDRLSWEVDDVVQLGCFCSSAHLKPKPMTPTTSATTASTPSDLRMDWDPSSPARVGKVQVGVKELLIQSSHFIKAVAALALAVKALIVLQNPQRIRRNSTASAGRPSEGSPNSTSELCILDSSSRQMVQKLVAGIRDLASLVRQMA